MIITSLLDTDLYKFTMMQVVLHHFPSTQAEYRFKCRTPGVELASLIPQIQEQIDHLCTLYFTEAELDYLRGLRFITSDFVDFLALFHLNKKWVSLKASTTVAGEIDLTIKGPWLHTILFEIPLLAIINEVYFRHTHPAPDYEFGIQRLQAKTQLLLTQELQQCRIADYGTRRRFSRAWQQRILQTGKQLLGPQLVGTSNVMFAQQLGMIPLGTMAHEYLQACQALGPRLRDSQVFGFEKWAQEYRGDLGIALSDVYGLNAFLKDFDMYFCKLFDGARHDSGDPILWGERMIEHYRNNRVDPKTKVLIFSDSLTIPKVIELFQCFKDRTQLSFGIGTNLTNDLGPTPLQIVIKLVRCNGQPVAKVSDTPSKNMCDDPAYMAYLRHVFGITT